MNRGQGDHRRRLLKQIQKHGMMNPDWSVGLHHGNAAIRFWCGVSEHSWNFYSPEPGPFACVSPIYGNATSRKRGTTPVILPGVQVIQDSGAFSDGPGERCSFRAALVRQERHAERYGYANQIAARASYDLLIDEMWSESEGCGVLIRRKQRWTETAAEEAVRETVQAARFLAAHRNGLPCILSAQGVTPHQYLRCVQQIVPLMQKNDILGLGGWCVVGKVPAQLLPVFRETMALLLPFLGREGISRVHLWGVIFAQALASLLWLCDQYGITLSTDSIGPSVRPAFGRWGYADWCDWSYRSAPALPPEREQDAMIGAVKAADGTSILLPHVRGIHRAEHVRQVRVWLAHLRDTSHYPIGEPSWLRIPRQLTLAF
jgi:hypothetical protein